MIKNRILNRIKTCEWDKIYSSTWRHESSII